MNTPPKDADANRRTPRSSIAVSDKIVCEGEACIGKSLTHPTAAPEDAEQEGGNKKGLSSSMSVGGRDACSGEACIGK